MLAADNWRKFRGPPLDGIDEQWNNHHRLTRASWSSQQLVDQLDAHALKSIDPRIGHAVLISRGRRQTLHFGVLFDIPTHLVSTGAFAFFVLFLVLDFDLGEIERDVFREAVFTARSTRGY